MPHSGKHGLVPTFLRCVDAMKFKINLFFPYNYKFSQFKHLICHLCCILNKILKFETSTSLHSVFIHNLYSVPTFLESGLYFIQLENTNPFACLCKGYFNKPLTWWKSSVLLLWTCTSLYLKEKEGPIKYPQCNISSMATYTSRQRDLRIAKENKLNWPDQETTTPRHMLTQITTHKNKPGITLGQFLCVYLEHVF